MQIKLAKLRQSDRLAFWQLAFSNQNAEWTKWNGPYFHDQLPTRTEFMDSDSACGYLGTPFRKIIWLDNEMVGAVFAYYEDKPLNHWLDVGIVIYQQKQWHQGIGKQALKLWINELFDTINLPHIGLTTWSGNDRMIGLAKSLNLTKEAQVRQVRFWQGQYWDSIKYGVLRDEWQ